MNSPEEDLQDFIPSTEAETEEDVELTREQIDAVAKLESLGYKKIGHYSDGGVRFGTKIPTGSSRIFDVGAEHLQFASLNAENYCEHSEYKGITSRDGTYAEFMINYASSRTPAGRAVEQYNWKYQAPDCDHAFDPWTIRSGTREYTTGFHIRSPKKDACIELSEISPVSHFATPTGSTWWPADYTEYTLKVWVTSSGTTEANTRQAQQIAHNILFEMDAKEGGQFSLISQGPVRVDVRRTQRSTDPHSIAFPSTIVPREVAALFSFAGEAFENPPFTFLSYYQVLEYYMPLVSRRDALRQVRREIRDLSFDVSNDASVLRVLNTVERAKGVSEEEALKILVRDCARADRLAEFFQPSEMAQHFSKKGPIAGVPAINVNSTSETLATQTARRIYALRNRIVHAKDDPRYISTPQLLPRSAEANSLGPDIRLARFLALEAVTDNQD
ncbi:hypothetical protein AB0N79_16055 [Streptomyces microflavus]|uniref:hypothetical protein n=1 Tax=Streptomyces microflavus TaxID=1919 RepID=UPI003417DE50